MGYNDPRMTSGSRQLPARKWGKIQEQWAVITGAGNVEFFSDLHSAKKHAMELTETTRATSMDKYENHFEYSTPAGYEAHVVNERGAIENNFDEFFQPTEPSKKVPSVSRSEVNTLRLKPRPAGETLRPEERWFENTKRLLFDISPEDLADGYRHVLATQDPEKIAYYEYQAARFKPASQLEKAGIPQFPVQKGDVLLDSKGNWWVVQTISPDTRKIYLKGYASNREWDGYEYQLIGEGFKSRDTPSPKKSEDRPSRSYRIGSDIPKSILNEMDKMPEAYSEVFTESDPDAHRGYSYWVYLNPDYFSPDMGCRTIREATAEQVVKMLKDVRPIREGEDGWEESSFCKAKAESTTTSVPLTLPQKPSRKWGKPNEEWLVIAPDGSTSMHQDLVSARQDAISKSSGKLIERDKFENYFFYGDTKLVNLRGAYEKDLTQYWTLVSSTPSTPINPSGSKSSEEIIVMDRDYLINKMKKPITPKELNTETVQYQKDLEEIRDQLVEWEAKRDALQEKMDNRDDGGTEKQQEKMEEIENEIADLEYQTEELESLINPDSTPSEPAKKMRNLRFGMKHGDLNYIGEYDQVLDTGATRVDTDVWDEDAQPLTMEQKSAAQNLYWREKSFRKHRDKLAKADANTNPHFISQLKNKIVQEEEDIVRLKSRLDSN